MAAARPGIHAPSELDTRKHKYHEIEHRVSKTHYTLLGHDHQDQGQSRHKSRLINYSN